MSSTQHPRYQVFTDEPVANYMAMQAAALTRSRLPIAVLDPGSGPGTLLESFINQFYRDGHTSIQAVAVERDPILAFDASTLELPSGVALEVHNEDFFDFIGRTSRTFSHIIMNPPYGRPEKNGPDQQALRALGLPLHNLYAAFLEAAFRLLADDGVLIAIVPRSVLTGTLANGLRKRLLSQGSIELVTTFASRKLAFTRDDVQQDVVVLGLRKNPKAAPSSDDLTVRVGRVDTVHPWTHEERRIPYRALLRGTEDSPYLAVPNLDACDLGDQSIVSNGLAVSTGRVVDFRSRQYIGTFDGPGTVPLIDARSRKGARRFLRIARETLAQIHSPGLYVTLDRFSPPEQTPRVVARLIDATQKMGVAFENHVNVIHRDGGPLTRDEAKRVLDLLNHPSISEQLSELSSSTHINATDIRRLKEPQRADT